MPRWIRRWRSREVWDMEILEESEVDESLRAVLARQVEFFQVRI